MIQRLLKWVLSLVKSTVDESIPEEQLHTYLRKGLAELQTHLEKGAIEPAHLEVMDLIELVGHLKGGGFTGLPSFSEWAGASPSGPDSARQFTNGALLHRGLIDGTMVEAFAVVSRQGKPPEDSDRTMLEGLLRHIEVRRRSGLRFVGNLSNHGRWRSVARISTLFSQVARDEGDLRYLNAALKLNDWAYRYFKRRRAAHNEVGYLCALLEAEWALMELIS